LWDVNTSKNQLGLKGSNIMIRGTALQSITSNFAATSSDANQVAIREFDGNVSYYDFSNNHQMRLVSVGTGWSFLTGTADEFVGAGTDQALVMHANSNIAEFADAGALFQREDLSTRSGREWGEFAVEGEGNGNTPNGNLGLAVWKGGTWYGVELGTGQGFTI
jgi:hypothetical protein